MKNFLMFYSLCIVLLFICCVHSSNLTSIPGDVKSIIGDKGYGDSLAQLKEFEKKAGFEFGKLDKDNCILIVGDNLNAPQRAILELIKYNFPEIANTSISASKVEYGSIQNTGKNKTILLIGGPSQNRISDELQNSGLINETMEFPNGIVGAFGSTGNGAIIAVIADKRGFSNLGRKAAESSPLALIMPIAFVPIAASFIGAILLPIFNIIRAAFEFAALDLGRKEKKIGESRFILFGYNIFEIGTFIGASVVLGAALTFTFTGFSAKFFGLLPMNSFICFFAGLAHELVHLVFSRIFRIKIEYHFWPWGSFTTIVTAFLGNSFGIQGFLLEEIPEEVAKWKVLLMKTSAPLFSAAIMIVFAFLNFMSPSVFFQMVFSISSLWAMAEILPIKPLDGYDIKNLNFLAWLACFLFISVSFVFVNFFL